MAVYFIRNTRTGSIKIGTSTKPQRRIRTFQTGHEDPLEILLIVHEWGRPHEQLLHQKFAHLRIDGGGTEWFAPSSQLLAYIEAARRDNGVLAREQRLGLLLARVVRAAWVTVQVVVCLLLVAAVIALFKSMEPLPNREPAPSPAPPPAAPMRQAQPPQPDPPVETAEPPPTREEPSPPTTEPPEPVPQPPPPQPSPELLQREAHLRSQVAMARAYADNGMVLKALEMIYALDNLDVRDEARTRLDSARREIEELADRGTQKGRKSR